MGLVLSYLAAPDHSPSVASCSGLCCLAAPACQCFLQSTGVRHPRPLVICHDAPPPQMWHPEHFACESCSRPFDLEETYYDKDGKPYCTSCNERLFLTCPSCQLPVTEDQVRASSRYWSLWVVVFCKCGLTPLRGSCTCVAPMLLGASVVDWRGFRDGRGAGGGERFNWWLVGRWWV